MRLYRFCYRLTDRHTFVPLFLTVQARTLRAATKAARRELKAIVQRGRAAYWHYEGSGWGSADMRPVYVPYHHLRGILYTPGHVVKPLRLRNPDAARLSATPEAAEALASVMSCPIIQSIESAPVLVNLFSVPLPEVPTPSIPLVWTTPMPRELWLSARRSRHED